MLGYADANGNGVLEPQEIQLGDTAIYAGPTVPDFSTSFGTTVSLWRGALTLDAGFAYQDGFSQTNEVARRLAPFSQGTQDPTASLAQQVAMMDLTSTDYNWIQIVNTLRFNNIGLRYKLPAAATRRLGTQNVSIMVQGSNLGVWTNYRGLDPNVNAFSTGNSVTDTGILPRPRTWQVRVSANY